MAVHRGIGDHHPFRFRGVGGPEAVLFQVVTQILLQHRAVEGADHGDVQSGGLFQQVLHLGAVLAHNADIVPAGFIVPIFLHVQRTELAEAVGGKQHFIGAVVGDDHFRPVYHGSGDEGELVLAQRKGVPFPHHQFLILQSGARKSSQSWRRLWRKLPPWVRDRRTGSSGYWRNDPAPCAGRSGSPAFCRPGYPPGYPAIRG